MSGAAHDNVRLEALCDGVFAIAMTLLILDVRLPSPESLTSASGLWQALRHLAPTTFAFALSFVVIFITWVNHHAMMKSVTGSSGPFIYANGVLLLTVVALPFPTALLGEFLLTDHAAPAVVLYDAALTAQSIGWVLAASAVLNGRLTAGERATSTMRESRRNGLMAVGLYSALAVAALWFPQIAAMITTATFVFWLAVSIRTKRA